MDNNIRIATATAIQLAKVSKIINLIILIIFKMVLYQLVFFVESEAIIRMCVIVILTTHKINNLLKIINKTITINLDQSGIILLINIGNNSNRFIYLQMPIPQGYQQAAIQNAPAVQANTPNI